MPTNPIPVHPIPAARYYPRLSEVITVDDLPEFLSFVENGLNSIFNKIHYKNLQYSKGYRGDSAFYSLDIVTSSQLALPLPFDLKLVLNPDLQDGDQSISSFPVTLEYQWEILAFIKTFSSSSFSFSLEDFYSVGLQVFRISEEQVIAHMLNLFVETADGITKFEQLLKDINDLQALTNDPSYQELKLPVGVEQSIDSVIKLINSNPKITKSIPLLLFAVYILQSDLTDTKKKLQEFYNIIVPDGIEAHIKRIITPKAKATLALSAGIEFPHSILKPVDPKNPSDKSMFIFAQAQLYADTEAGIGYQAELGGSLTPPKAMIGNSGLILELDTLKVDLSKKTNIPEADADGRPNDFVGVYARAASVTLPSKWFHEETKEGEEENSKPTLKIGASDLLIGSGGLSGNIFLETVPEPKKDGSFSYFNDKFDFYYPITMFEKDEVNGVVNEKEIENYPALLVFLRKLNTAKLPYAFKFPLVLKTQAGLTSATIIADKDYSFDNAVDYQVFLSQLEENMLWKTIGSPKKGFKVGFNKFDIAFKQNKVVSSNIKGALEIPKLKEKNGDPLKVGLEGHLYDDGDFNLTASFAKDNKPKANLFDLVNLDFHSFELGKQDDDYYLGTSCSVSFPDETLMGSLLKGKGFEVEKLRVYSDGNIEVEGGSIPIPISLSVNLGPVQMAVTNVNFGSTQINGRKYNFWGFDGAISINPLGVDARGEGVKYYYAVDGSKDSFIRIQTIEVDLTIPGTATESSAMAIIHGMITLPEPGKSKEFIGEVGLKLPKAKISGSVGMRFMPKYPAFLIDANIDLPVPIPLGFLAINAFRGLLGFRYVATKQAAGLTKDDSWYDFYKHPKPGINIKKFSGPPDSMQYDTPFSIGAGATFGTVADGGHVLSLRAMLLLSLPTLFYIEAGLNVISGRLGLIETDPSNPPFFAMVAFGDDSLELAAGADFSIPKDSGQIFKLHALLEAGFFFKNQKPWYVNIGSKKDPIEARILTLFTAKAFIMLSAQGIEAGARLDFKLQQSFGPAKVKLWAYLELGGKISFKRPQMGGYITAGGGIQIKLLIINVEIALDTIFSIESFKPFLIYAKLELSVRIKIGPFRVRKNFMVELQWDINRIVDRTPYSPLPKGTVGDGEDDRTLENVKGVHMLTNQAFALDYFKSAGDKNYDPTKLDNHGMPKPELITKVIPLDTYIDIKMAKGLLPNPELSKKVGGYTADAKNYTDLMPPVSTQAGRKLRQVKHEYGIKSIELKSWNGSAWENYNPFEAVVKENERNDDLKKLPWAQWQKAIDQYDSIRVLATNPFSFLSAGEPGWHVPEQLGITPSRLFCASSEIEKQHTDFLNKQIGQRYYVPMQYEADKINGLFFKLLGELPEITANNTLEGGDFMSITSNRNTFGYDKSLSFRNENELEIIFPESAIDPTLQLTTQAKEVVISAYTSIIVDGEKLTSYVPVRFRKTETGLLSEQQTYTKAEFLNDITLYSEEVDDQKKKIDKIVISPLSANANRIKKIRNEIATLFYDTYGDLTGETEITLTDPEKIIKYNSLLSELEILKLNAGNDNPNSGGNPNALTFTHYYGYNGGISYAFDQIIKFNDSYVIIFHPETDSKTTILLQVNSDGTVIRERLINGIVTSVQVVNGNLLVTQALNPEQCKGIGEATVDLDFIVGCLSPIATTAIVEMDEELNPISGTQYLNTYSLGFNKVLPLAGNDLLWINTISNETQISWIKGSDRTIVYHSKINNEVLKVLQLNDTEFTLITKDKKIIRLGINNASKVITVTNTKVLSTTEIVEVVDAVITNNKILLSVKLSNDKFGLAQLDGNTVVLVKNDTIFDSAVYLSNNALNNNSIVAYNSHYLFVFNETLDLTRLIQRESDIKNASIIQVQNEPSVNEILMVSAKSKEKGIYFSLFSDAFDNCSLYPAATVTVTKSTTALTNGSVNVTALSPITGLDFIRNLKISKIITTDAVICSNVESSEDPELDYTTYIQSVAWLGKEDYYHNKTILDIPAVAEQFQAMKAAVENTIQPIWRPNTTYCLDFTLTDTVDDNKKSPAEFKYYYGFKTLGPIGHYPVPDSVTPENQDPPAKNELTELSKSTLTSLRSYLDYNRSYPNADGSLLLSKPSFYGNKECNISLFFNNPYTSHMFKNWAEYDNGRPEIKGALNLFIKDPLTDLLIEFPMKEKEEGEEEIIYPKPEEIDDESKNWTGDNDPRIPLGIQILNNFIEDTSTMKCNLELGNPLKPKSLKYKTSLTNLKPSKLYTVLVNNYFDGAQIGVTSQSKNILVHQFGFQTSRYKDFEEQVQSYFLDEEKTKGAIYDVNVNMDQGRIDALYYLIAPKSENIINALSDSIAAKYQHLFDRAIEGILKLSPLDPSQNTEVNRIIDTNSGATIALLIRNPEPFNIPKMPLDEIKNTITVLDGSGNLKSEYNVLYSKDYSQALIMNNNKMISEQEEKNLKIKFEYKMWNTEGNGTSLTNTLDSQILPLHNINL